MRKIALLTFVLLLFASLANAADFIDWNSPKHFFGSATIAATINTFAVEYDVPQKDRNIIAGVTTGLIGGFKEFVIDDSPSGSDIFFNLAGIAGGLYASEKWFITPMEHGVVVTVLWD